MSCLCFTELSSIDAESNWYWALPVIWNCHLCHGLHLIARAVVTISNQSCAILYLHPWRMYVDQCLPYTTTDSSLAENFQVSFKCFLRHELIVSTLPYLEHLVNWYRAILWFMMLIHRGFLRHWNFVSALCFQLSTCLSCTVLCCLCLDCRVLVFDTEMENCENFYFV